jgi:hypothetical protein
MIGEISCRRLSGDLLPNGQRGGRSATESSRQTGMSFRNKQDQRNIVKSSILSGESRLQLPTKRGEHKNGHQLVLTALLLIV